MNTKLLGVDFAGWYLFPRWVLELGHCITHVDSVRVIRAQKLKTASDPLGEVRAWSHELDGVVIFAGPSSTPVRYERLIQLQQLCEKSGRKPFPVTVIGVREKGSLSNICIGVLQEHYRYIDFQDWGSLENLMAQVPIIRP